ncbi:hypothetical protein Desmer_0478 [Desulfosporosinus meridiei DSM 13257]|uniref:Uncharacterized protein n=1 Tax=Desulfosporosinus meridiei (strain ATCC BAA-275 / DSM 13257 / KCTC 12902 / NCIMB 13706 / S10) TaxID=768704 RepID=J7IL57_DESMD|nr:hypothetical protein Desmer_0478 [Desulfosporosinus meridiei DSM 13257]
MSSPFVYLKRVPAQHSKNSILCYIIKGELFICYLTYFPMIHQLLLREIDHVITLPRISIHFILLDGIDKFTIQSAG